jgi:signal peptidase I
VGLPGEELEVVEGTLYVNQQPIVEEHSVQEGFLNIGRGKLATGRFALLGDNRGLPEGQTISAIVSKNDMVGQVVYCVPVGG